MATILLSRIQQRDNLKIQLREALHACSTQIASLVPQERAVGMSSAIEYLKGAQTSTPARQVILTALHYDRAVA